MANKISETFKKIFDTQRVGKGVKKEELNLPYTLKNFFKYYFNQFDVIFKLNMMMVFGNFPILFLLFGMTGYLNRTVSTAASSLFPQLYGAMTISGGENPAFAAMFGVHGVQATASYWTPATYICIGLTALLLVTFGPVNVGTTYIMRNRLRRQPVFFMSDFFYAVKKNLVPGLIMGVIDLGLIALFIYNITFSLLNASSTLGIVVFCGNIAMLMIYILMRFYVYLFIVTFDLSLWKCIKNSLIFSILGVKRNFMALIGLVVVFSINYFLFITVLPLGVMLPFVVSIGTGTYISMYAAWPKIREVMIDPYYPDYDKPAESDEEDEEVLCRDLGDQG